MNVQGALNLLCQEAFSFQLQKDVLIFQAAFMKLVIGGNIMLTEFKGEIITTGFSQKIYIGR